MLKAKGLVIAIILVVLAYAEGFAKTFKINDGWRFIQQEVTGGEEPGADDSSWGTISIPHNWGYAEAQKGNRGYYRGPGWYRRDLGSDFKEGYRYFIRFGAASSIADVYLNGVHLGQHRGGFSAFCYEMTSHLNFDGRNILAVRVSNAAREDVLPLTGDFNIYGGLYRSVHIIEKPLVCFDPTDHASAGVTWLQTEVSKEKAVLDVTAWVSNASKEYIPFTWFPPLAGERFADAGFRLVARLFDENGNCVAETEKEINLGKDTCSPYELRLTLENPRLWNGRADPYLYSAVMELYSEDGTSVERVENKIGLRFFHIDPDTGFYLNGESYRLRGVCRHQDRKDQGWALSQEDQEEDLDLILEMGANAVRLAHYQHDSYFHQLCDEKGILLYVEIPLVGTIGTDPAISENARQQMLDLVRQNINHCSIFAWGIFNELALRDADPLRMVYELNQLTKAEDPTRLTIAATHNPVRPQLNRITDILGWNRYPGWYDPMDHLFDFDMWDKYKPTSRHGGMSFSEYGAGANTEQHEQNPDQPIPKGFWHPEEWQSMVHENHWACFKNNPFVWGTFVWNMFDFASGRRAEGGKLGLNDKGLVTFDRTIKKDAYYFYKANWSASPTLYLTSKRHTVRNDPVTPVKVYSNQGPATLTVNGKVIGTAEPSDVMICQWDDVVLVHGQNHIRVEAGGLADEVIWVVDPNVKTGKPETEKAKRIGGDGGVGAVDN